MMPVEFEIMVVKVGNSLRITLPKEICKATAIREGSTVGVSLTDSEIKVRKLA
jgi:AbrB family looped-hinge helix DNA binding protein